MRRDRPGSGYLDSGDKVINHCRCATYGVRLAARADYPAQLMAGVSWDQSKGFGTGIHIGRDATWRPCGRPPSNGIRLSRYMQSLAPGLVTSSAPTRSGVTSVPVRKNRSLVPLLPVSSTSETADNVW